MEELAGCERHRRGVKEAAAEADEGDQRKKLQRIDEMIGQLRGHDVQAEEEGQAETEDGGGSEDGIDADEKASGEAPGELFGGCSTAQEREDGEGDAAVGPVVMRGGFSLSHY